MSRINVGKIARRVQAGAAMVILLACATSAVQADDRAIFVTSPGQPLNVGDAMLAAIVYHDSGPYDRDVALVARQARHRIPQRAPAGPRPALVVVAQGT